MKILQRQGMMGMGEMEDDSGMVMEMEGAWNLGGIRLLSCIRAGIGMLVCVLVLEVVVVLAVVLVRMVLMVWVMLGGVGGGCRDSNIAGNTGGS